MEPPSDNEHAVIVAVFLERLIADRASGSPRGLAEYQAQFPGYEDLIAAEYAAVCSESAVTVDGVLSRMRDRLGRDADPGVSLRGTRSDRADDESVSRYQSLGELAHGGMGVVFRVWDRDLRRPLAMKLLKRTSLLGDAVLGSQQLTRFLQEAQITAQLAHPGIVPVHELGLDADGRVYFSMSLVRGVTFDRVIQRVHDAAADEWTLARALGVLQRVCETVAFAHDRGVVHRDLKPANVMVGAFGEAYVMDWGLAAIDDPNRPDEARIQSSRHEIAAAGRDDALLTRGGDVLGTPAFMAPEQACGETEAIGVRSDVYALGAILYHLLTGRPPYSGRSRDVLDAVLAGPPPPLQERCSDAPDELVAICERAMARDPMARYGSAIELGQDLAAHLEQRVVRAYETGAAAELRKWVRRNRAPALAGALAILALVAGLVVSLVLTEREQRATAGATRNAELAFDAIDKALSRIGSEHLNDVPQIDVVRRDLLEDARRMLAKLEAQGGSHARAEIARLRRRMEALR